MFNAGPKPELTTRCHLGTLPGDDCAHLHVARALPKGLGGYDSLRLCPGHDGREATLSFNVGNLFRVIWNEQAASCDIPDLDLYSLLLAKGVDETCLGTYGLRKQGGLKSAPRINAYDPAVEAAANRAHAILKLPMDLPGHLYKMCVQAIMDGDGFLPGDPAELLPGDQAEFTDLARRCGFERSYCRKLWIRWSEDSRGPSS